MKVAELEGVMLDLWVARAMGYSSVGALERESNLCVVAGDGFQVKDWNPSADWEQGGPIIEREHIDLRYSYSLGEWDAKINDLAWEDCSDFETGSTPLQAAMRAYVASKFGNEVPDMADAQPGSAD